MSKRHSRDTEELDSLQRLEIEASERAARLAADPHAPQARDCQNLDENFAAVFIHARNLAAHGGGSAEVSSLLELLATAVRTREVTPYAALHCITEAALQTARTDAAEAAETEAAERWLDQLDPDEIQLDDARYLRRVREAAAELDGAEARLRAAVAEAREHGETWGQIGMVLGVSRQAAQQRFTEVANNHLRDYALGE